MATFLHAGRQSDVRSSLQRSCQLGSLARQALIAEAELTPKPGLVDRRGSGAHTDLSLDLMRRSARVLEPFFTDMASAAEGRVPDRDLRAELAAIGRDAERAMYKATEGANSHKGAIWILGSWSQRPFKETVSRQERSLRLREPSRDFRTGLASTS